VEYQLHFKKSFENVLKEEIMEFPCCGDHFY